MRQWVFGAIQGLFEISSVHGASYALSFIDDFRNLQEFMAEHCACELTIEVRIHQMHTEKFVENAK